MHGSDLLTLFMQIGLILAVSRVIGWAFSRLHQPQVMGEMVAGILLGPSLLKWLAPGIWAMVFPAQSINHLSVLSQVGVVFFLFLVGLELDPTLLRSRGRAAVTISAATIVAPFILGAGLTLYFFHA